MLRLLVIAFACVPLILAQPRPGSPVLTTPSTTGWLHGDAVSKILGIVTPDQPPRLSKRARFRRYVLDTIGPAPLIGEAAGAGISQWINTPEEWGQGWGAYGKRYGANLAYNAVRQTITYTSSIALREDYRYLPASERGTWPRLRHALVSTFTARGPDGTNHFAISSVSGVIGASAIASVWGPPSWEGPGNIARNASVSFGATAGFNVVREFLPDLLGRPRR